MPNQITRQMNWTPHSQSSSPPSLSPLLLSNSILGNRLLESPVHAPPVTLLPDGESWALTNEDIIIACVDLFTLTSFTY
jgi:hypothetical protein